MMTAPPVMMVMVMTAPPAIVVMMVPDTVMMMVMILHQRHVRVRRGCLRAPRGLGRVHGPEHRERVRDRLEQLGVGLSGSQPRRVRGLETGGLGAVEGRQA